jgi:cellular nucleic acid-binding protein
VREGVIGVRCLKWGVKDTVMASLARRACYKCGTVGHFAETCNSTERLCYNCKQPGHESNGCPHPRTTESKQCYHCQGMGHVQAACPTLRLTSMGLTVSCYHCGQPGHLARNCPGAILPPRVGIGRAAPIAPLRPAYGPYRVGFVGGPRAATCYKCGGPNHYARDCQAQSTKCYACGKLGHISRDCTAPNGGPLNTAGKKCYRCGDPGHISRDCAQPDQHVDMTGATNNGMVPVASVAQAAAAPPTAVA